MTNVSLSSRCNVRIYKARQALRSAIDKIRSEKLISLTDKGLAAKYVMFDGLSGN